MNIRIAALVATAIFAANPAFAQIAPYDAEIDCDGPVIPGSVVPFMLRFENQSQNTIPLNVTVSIRVPGLGSFQIRQAAPTLGPNQDLNINQQIRIPAQAPNGSYTMTIVASSAQDTVMDTCSFNVV